MLPGKLKIIQCVMIPLGPSISSVIRAKDWVSAGVIFQLNGGERLSPCCVYLTGIRPPWGKALLELERKEGAGLVDEGGTDEVWVGEGDAEQAAIQSRARTAPEIIIVLRRCFVPMESFLSA